MADSDGPKPPRYDVPSTPWFHEQSTQWLIPGHAAEDLAEDPAVLDDAPRLVDRGLVATGGMSSIRRVFDNNLRREVALKVMLPELKASKGSAMLLDEARVTGQLEHPNIVPVYDLNFDRKGTPVFAMKLVDGCTFTQFLHGLASHGLSQRLHAALQVFLKVCDAVSFAHSRGVIHRDLKPDNIMVGSHGQVYVMDWGCALVAESGADKVALGRPARSGALEQPGIVVGTTAYMAPEQACGLADEIDARTDVFALGAILYQVLTGRPPYIAGTPSQVLELAQRGEVPPPATLTSGLPEGLCQIAMTALAVAPAQRYASVEALQQAVEVAVADGLWLTTRTFAPGSLIVAEGDPADAAYLIRAGECDVFQVEHGQRVVLRRMGPGDLFGETAIFAQQPRSASVVAIDQVTATVVTREALESELARTSWAGAFVGALARRFADVDARLSELRRGSR